MTAMEWMEPLNEAPVVGLGEPLVATVLVDGALHIGADGYLHGFACLLDGRAIAGENRAREAAERARANVLAFDRTACVNDDAAIMEALADRVIAAVAEEAIWILEAASRRTA